LGYEACSDKHGLAQLYNNLAIAHINKEDWTLAGEYYRRSMDLCVELGDMDFLSILYINRARLALHLYDLATAEAYCDRALDTFSRTGNKIGEAQAYKVYGMVYSKLQEWYSAAAAFKTGIEICTEYGNNLTKAEILYELGVMMHRGDEKEKAVQHLQQSLEIYESLGIDEEAARIRDEMETVRQRHQTWC
jgi:tetratricopeptide (TPR) repeat protein